MNNRETEVNSREREVNNREREVNSRETGVRKQRDRSETYVRPQRDINAVKPIGFNGTNYPNLIVCI